MVANRPTIESTAFPIITHPTCISFLDLYYSLCICGIKQVGIKQTNSPVYSVSLLLGTLFPDYGYVYFSMHRISNSCVVRKPAFRICSLYCSSFIYGMKQIGILKENKTNK